MGAAQCLILEHESLESNEFFSSRSFCFPTDLTDFHRFLTPRGVFAVSLSEYRCLQRRESVQIREICGRTKISLAALHTEGAEDGSENGDDEVDDFLDCFLFHFN